MNRRLEPILCLMCLMSFLFVFQNPPTNEVHAAGSQLFVSPSGLGSACTQSSPCQPETAIALAVDYDAIYFAGGNYTGSTNPLFTITKSVSLYGGWDGTPSGNINLDPTTYITMIDGEGLRRLVTVNDPGGNYVISINGFSFINGFSPDDGGAIHVIFGEVLIEDNQFIDNEAAKRGGAIFVGSNLGVDIRENVFTNNDVNDSGSEGGSVYIGLSDPEHTNAVIEDNVFTDGNAYHGAAINITNSAALITKNLIKDSSGISTVRISSAEHTSVICNNIIVRSSQNAIDISGNVTFPNQVLNNTIIAAGFGIASYSETKINITNNIISNSGTSIQVFGGDVTGSNNLFYGNISDPENLNDTVTADPHFIDSTNDDFHIQEGSPAQDAGFPVSLSFDFDGESRPSGYGYDIGADEIMSGVKIFLPLILR